MSSLVEEKKLNFEIVECPEYKTLYNEKDIDFLNGCIRQCYDGMKHLNHWDYNRTKFFNAIPKNLKIVEVGVHCGKNAYRIHNVCKPSHLYLVDPWDRVPSNISSPGSCWGSVKEQQDNEKLVRSHFKDIKNVTILKNWSEEASKFFKNEELDFVYIDGDHNYEAVLNDLKCWSMKIREGGFLGGHDYDSRPQHPPGDIQLALETFLKENINYKLIYKPPAHLFGINSSDGHYDFMLQKD